MPSPILARADALMQRRRPTTEIDDVPVLTDAVDLTDSDDDIPVLLDIEANAPQLPLDQAPEPDITPIDLIPPPGSGDELQAEPEPVTAAPSASGQAAPIDSALARADIAHEIARRVELRLAAELPNIVAAAVRDYLAEQHEPPDETDSR